jgi:hypothetical protein
VLRFVLHLIGCVAEGQKILEVKLRGGPASVRATPNPPKLRPTGSVLLVAGKAQSGFKFQLQSFPGVQLIAVSAP